MRKKSFRMLLLTVLLIAAFPMSVFADEETSQVGSIVFSAGSSTNVEAKNASDLFSAGSDVNVSDCAVKGNVFTAGNSVGIDGVTVGADVFAAGNMVKIGESRIDGNIYMAGNSLTVRDTVVDTAIMAGNEVKFEGEAGSVNISGNNVTFNGVIEGDAVIEADNVTIGADAIVRGNLTVKSSNEPKISDTAMCGSYDYEKIKDDESDTNEAAKKVGIFAKFVAKISSLLYWIPAMVLLGLILCFVFGSHLDGAKDLIVSNTGSYIASGAISWIAIPVCCLVIACTVIGLPIAAIVTTLYIVAIWMGLTFAGCSLGRMVLPKLHPILASLIGVAVLEVVRIIPIIGGVVAVAADMYLLGYIVLSFINSRKSAKPAVLTATLVEEAPAVVNQEEAN